MSLVTPLQFNTVQVNLYRGSYPRAINLPFLKTLRLKCILSLTPEPLDEVVSNFCRENNIRMKHIECHEKAPKDGATKVKRKKKRVPIDYDIVNECIRFLIDKDNYPLYLHCKNGELISSLVIACLRKFTHWSTVSILNEFLIYNSSINVYERGFIEDFEPAVDLSKLRVENVASWALSDEYTKTERNGDKKGKSKRKKGDETRRDKQEQSLSSVHEK